MTPHTPRAAARSLARPALTLSRRRPPKKRISTNSYFSRSDIATISMDAEVSLGETHMMRMQR
jgi:hypothetical protein